MEPAGPDMGIGRQFVHWLRMNWYLRGHEVQSHTIILFMTKTLITVVHG
jgi:hypothetical protein